MNLLFNYNNIDELVKIKHEVTMVKALLNCLALFLATLFIIQTPVMVNVEAFNEPCGSNTSDNKVLKRIVESISSSKTHNHSILNLIETTGADA